jgi:hypothetical protein
MTNLPKFKFDNATGKEQKLIVELVKDLNETTTAFINLNYQGNLTTEMFVILRDSALAYCLSIIFDLTKMLANKSQINEFLEENREMFDAYMENIRKALKCTIN